MWVAPSRFAHFIIGCSFAPRLTQLSQYLLVRSIVRNRLCTYEELSTTESSSCLDFVSVRGEGELRLVGLREEAALGNGPDAHAAVVARHRQPPRVERVEAKVHHVAPVDQHWRHLADNLGN